MVHGLGLLLVLVHGGRRGSWRIVDRGWTGRPGEGEKKGERYVREEM